MMGLFDEDFSTYIESLCESLARIAAAMEAHNAIELSHITTPLSNGFHPAPRYAPAMKGPQGSIGPTT